MIGALDPTDVVVAFQDFMLHVDESIISDFYINI